MVAGRYQTKPPLPFSPGLETAGVVAACGDGVTRFKPGDRVMAILPYGGIAEQALADEVETFAIPLRHGLRRGRRVSHRLHLEPRGDPLAGTARARRDAAGAGRGRRRRPHRGGDRQGDGRARDRRRQHGREARGGARAGRRRGGQLREREADRARDGADLGQGRRRVLRSHRRRAVRRRTLRAGVGRTHSPGRLRGRGAADPGQPAAGQAPRRARLLAALLPLARAGQAEDLGRRAAAVVRRGQAPAAGERPSAARAQRGGHSPADRPPGPRQARGAAGGPAKPWRSASRRTATSSC